MNNARALTDVLNEMGRIRQAAQLAYLRGELPDKIAEAHGRDEHVLVRYALALCPNPKPGSPYSPMHAYFRGADCRGFERRNLVYFIWAPESDAVKIGFSSQLRSRLQQLRASSPAPLIPVLLLPGTETAEERIHADLPLSRLHSEWFAVGPAVGRVARQLANTSGAIAFRYFSPFLEACR